MKIIVTISRIITGIVFTFSGFVKLVDPVGTEIKFGDYFDAMGIEFLLPFALTFSFLMNAAEFVIGVLLILNIFPRIATWFSFGFLMLFTPIMLWIAVTDAVTDCGCFGDFLILSNWQTFYKNIIFLAIVLILIIRVKDLKSKLNFKKSFLWFALIAILTFGFQFYNYLNLPIFDFRPFKEGVNIVEASEIPEDAEQDIYETVLYYKNLNTGKSTPFSIDSIPYEDTLTWAYDTTITELVSKGYEPPIHDFFLTELNGNDITEDILNENDLSFIFVMHKINKSYKRVKNVIDAYGKYAESNRNKIYCFTSSSQADIQEIQDHFPENIIICTGDYKMLKTLLRSDPGFVLLKDAEILKKYHYKNIPEISEIENFK